MKRTPSGDVFSAIISKSPARRTIPNIILIERNCKAQEAVTHG